MRVLVTGAAGFIGRHVCKALWEAGHEVFEVDLVAPEGKGHLWTVHDITKPFSQSPVILDAVIHLAALAAPRECDANPTRAFDINVNGTLQVLRMALASGAKKVVFSSSAHVFDIPPKWLPTDETHPLRLNNTYTTTKILGEELCELFWENHGLPYTTLRLFNAYGPGQSLGYFIPDQIAKAAKGDFELSGSNVTKDWVHVNDVAEAFVLALESSYVGALNVGTGVEIDLGTIARIIAKAYGVQVNCKPAAVPTRMCADWHRAQRILGWSPKVSLPEGLHELLGNQAKVPTLC